jgi:hypothetical protein
MAVRWPKSLAIARLDSMRRSLTTVLGQWIIQWEQHGIFAVMVL